MDLSKVQLKERIAEESYTHFYRNRSAGRLREASRYLWLSAENLIFALGALEGKEITTAEETIVFLNELMVSGDLVKEDIDVLKAIKTNAIRGTLDEELFEKYVERSERIIRKIKDMLKTKVIEFEKLGEHNHE